MYTVFQFFVVGNVGKSLDDRIDGLIFSIWLLQSLGFVGSSLDGVDGF